MDATDHFLQPMEQALRERFHVSRFAPRFIKAPVVGMSVNKLLFHLQFRRFLASHDVAFFEWAGSLLVQATHMPKRCRIVTRLHSMEVASAAHRVDWSQVDATIVVSEQMKQRLLLAAKAPPPYIQIINYGIDLSRFHFTQKPFRHRVGMIARVVPVKRVYEAVLVIYELRRRGYPFTLAVGGPLGDELEPRYPWAIRELIERLDLAKHVSLLGLISDPASLYAEIDVFLSNSFWEGQQNSLIEAMASGCYCLSHCWGGAEEVLPPEQIFITDSELQAKLVAYASLSEPEKAARQNRMRTLAETKFSVRDMERRVVQLIEKLRWSS
ncbi:MAG: glycosyltransferase family 4 protein [Anaerolineae bacterium]|nr:glycosyltransferase family 4 protein [Anaerolineae bacterium]